MSMLRRTFLRFTGLLAAPVMAARSPEVRAYACQYRARATVLMLSMPLLHRDNVGSGYFRASESMEGGKRQLRLEFGAGSVPARAAGLNRLGIFEERIVESGELFESAQYFGFMTASNEKDLHEARAALNTNGTSSFTAIQGRIEKGKASNLLLKIGDVAAGDWGKREELTAEIRARFAGASESETRMSNFQSSDSPCSPFLYAVNRAMKDTTGSCTNRFMHNGKIHHLKTTRKRCAEAGVTELEGRIQDETQKELSNFRLWFDPEQADRGPLRFEFRPRSCLRLTFERV